MLSDFPWRWFIAFKHNSSAAKQPVAGDRTVENFPEGRIVFGRRLLLGCKGFKNLVSGRFSGIVQSPIY